MPFSLVPLALSATGVAALSAIAGVVSARPLEAKLAAVQRLLLVVALACVVVGIGVLACEPLPEATSSRAVTDAAQVELAHWQNAVRAESRALRATLSWGAFVAALLFVPLLLALRALRTFVLEHRLDLAARQLVVAQAGTGKVATNAG